MNWMHSLLRFVLGERAPVTEGRLSTSGLEDELRIRRDGWGVPHIRAECDRDAWFGLGFCVAQDRRFQLEMLVRLARGRVSEVVGERGLPVDRMSRRIGFYHQARDHVANLEEESRRALNAYVSGINSGTDRGLDRLPHEFSLLYFEPLGFTMADVLAIGGLVGLGLNANWDSELARLKVLQEDGPQAVKDVDPSRADGLNVTFPPGEQAESPVEELARELDRLTNLAGTAGGASNNWTIAPEKTSTGRPILASDPHLPPLHPPHFYLCHLETPEWSVVGGTLVGLPGIAVGHNGYAAWGPTASNVDLTDFYLEDLGPTGRRVRRGDDYVECDVRRETIEVRGGEDVRETVLLTDRGPILTPVLDGHEDTALSFQATAYWPQRMRGYLELPRVRDFEQFRQGFEGWTALSLDYVYADEEGNIGWQTVGQAPARRKGKGLLPQPAWDPEVGWEDEPVDHDRMPCAKNPEAGFIATANNQPLGHNDDPFLGIDWLDGYRVTRIADQLESRDDWDVSSTLNLQTDQYSLPWEKLRPMVLDALEEAPDLDTVHRLLDGWDGTVSAESPAATVFEFFVAEMEDRIVRSRAPNAAEWALGKGYNEFVEHSKFALRRVSHLVRCLREQPPGWFKHGWTEEIRRAFRSVQEHLRSQYGSKTEDWVWGTIRPLTFEHPLGDIPLLGRVFNLGPFPVGGDTNTVSQASSVPLDVTCNPVAVPSMRMVADVGDWSNSRFVLPGGQSGNPLSPHYRDLLDQWRDGEGIRIPWTEEAVEEQTEETLRLIPR